MSKPTPIEGFMHLQPKAREALALSDDERVRFIRAGSWLPLEHAKSALSRFEELLTYPKVTRVLAPIES